MRIESGHIHLSPTDLSRHLSCRHLTGLDLRVERRELQRPYRDDPGVEVLRLKGTAHEAAYLEHLVAQGLRVLRLSEDSRDVEATRSAMRDGADAVAQAWLEVDRWRGRADVLLRVPGASELGDYHYEVVDTKLSAQTKAGTILQLCLYAELLAELQGRRPDVVKVVTPGRCFEPEVYRIDHYEAYYRRVKARLVKAVDNDTDVEPSTYPEPCEHCQVCDWWRRCDEERHRDDHLSLVANITRGQCTELTAWGITTLAKFGRQPLKMDLRPKRGSRESLDKAQHQASVQLTDRTSPTPYYEMLPVEGEGLTRLPEPDAADVFFDLEGDPFAGDGAAGAGGLEYLWGWVTLNTAGRTEYHHLWANDAEAERRAFEAFVDEVMTLRALYPGMHVYHYAPYEPATLKRLMGRFATREQEVDELLRGKVFVDLYAVTRQAVRAGVENYSIKQLERFFGYDRQIDLPDVSRPKRRLEAMLEVGQGADAPDEIRNIVRGYNEDDCVSTWRLRQWLEERRADAIEGGTDIRRPEAQEGEAGEELKEWQQELQNLRVRLLEGISPVREERTDEQQACWLLAFMLDWHWREEKAVWWEYYRLKELQEEELLDDKAAIAGMEFVKQLPRAGTERNPRYRYRYPKQIIEIREGDSLYDAAGENLGEMVGIDMAEMTVDIKQTGKKKSERPRCAFECTLIPTETMRESLMRLGGWVAQHGVDTGGPDSFARAGRDLLLGNSPRRQPDMTSPLRSERETATDAARRLIGELDGGALPIQGPPGSGKTYAGGRMIAELVKRGKRVGVAAVSHKVIENLLVSALKAGAAESVTMTCLHKVEFPVFNPIS